VFEHGLFDIHITTIYFFFINLYNMYIFTSSWLFHIEQFKIKKNIYFLAHSASLLKESKGVLNAIFDFTYKE
jgi:hypothetical protein